ncbi:hypothetical protein IWQ60_008598 [Tieghemiomyces parasiticus]|uniref:Ras-related protein Rab-38 n=1 Tax=Tieghemiomyces parasiticus TaxID=78921 RepID=A0A9W8A0U9_9FUNG|nr:hypothetical protein IWQ60_008598 [Tieghemiomyces parasiticus]
MTRVYYKEALGALLVYDVTNPDSFDGVEKWKRDLDDKVTLPTVFGGGGPVPAVLLANKCDLAAGTNHLPPRQSTRQLDRFCADHGFLAWFPTSAKENSNLEEAVRCLVDRLLELVQQSTEEGKGAGGGSRGAPSSDESGRVDLSAAPAHGSYFSRCC